MSKLTHSRAAKALASSDELADLAEAVAFLADDPGTRPEELLQALDRPGYIAEQAAIALHRMTQTPLSSEQEPILSKEFWLKRLKEEVGHRSTGPKPAWRRQGARKGKKEG